MGTKSRVRDVHELNTDRMVRCLSFGSEVYFEKKSIGTQNVAHTCTSLKGQIQMSEYVLKPF